MLLRLADGLRRFFKFSSRKNRLPVEPLARPVSGQEGKEKISEGDKCEPKGSQKNCGLSDGSIPKVFTDWNELVKTVNESGFENPTINYKGGKLDIKNT